MKKILVVDDHTVVRQGVIRTLETIPEYRFAFEEAANEAEALHRCQGTCYDLILLDLSLQGKNGIEVLKQLKRLAPKVPVLVLSMYPVEQYAARAIRAGASGYLNKESAFAELQTAVRRLLGGRKYLNEEVADLLLDALSDERDPQEPASEILSDREFEVLCMMASGKTMTEIAQELVLSVKTISTYRGRILEKLRLRTTGEMIAYAVKSGLGSI
ncbi:response regulator [Geomesophilobacter sediminis]|uniref:Response regulator transcription factor n=1 Tax=Geomesophilobacter sediminis TaxID=2798584 RepID=A0A8J7LY86_9BACT|nr:response regulator transcription factor [Geomesophilobacter sediminis]MBJ6724561.1 response regulator transcription factor [Geomesophilobacter sediminis]